MAARSALDTITISTPCTASWEAMKGDDRKRFCDSCRLHVYDVSAMTRAEAEALIFGSKTRVCTRLWRRADDTVITKDCVRIRLAIERRLRWIRVAAAAILGVIGFTGCESYRPPHATIGVRLPPPGWQPPPPAMGTPAVLPPPKPVNPDAKPAAR